MNVDCKNSEKFYNLNENIGTSNGLSMRDYMNQAKDMISFPKQMSDKNKPGGVNGGERNIPNTDVRGPNR
jgi:hypothetical protein